MLKLSTNLTVDQLLSLTWDDLKPYYQALQDITLHEGMIDDWLEGWSNLDKVVVEINNRRYVATTRDTTDQAAKEIGRAHV